jgi:hypothetical protein
MDALAATPKLRGYFGDRSSGYATRYLCLSATIAEHIGGKVPAQWQQAVHDLFRIIRVTDPRGRNDPKVKSSPKVEHEEVISGKGPAKDGSMAAALRASRDPTIDRADDVQNETPAPACQQRQSKKAPKKRGVQKAHAGAA